MKMMCAVCGGELRNDVGLISSPNYPNNYPNGQVCEWTIVLAADRQILLNVTDFVMEPSSTCSFDYLEIRRALIGHITNLSDLFISN